MMDADKIIERVAASKRLTVGARVAIIVAVGFLPIAATTGGFFLSRLVDRADKVVDKLDRYAREFDLLKQAVEFKVNDVQQDQAVVHRQLDDHEVRLRHLEQTTPR